MVSYCTGWYRLSFVWSGLRGALKVMLCAWVMAAMLHHAERAGGGGGEVVIWPVVPHHQQQQHCTAHRGGPLNKVITWSPTVVSLSPPSFSLPICHLIFHLYFSLVFLPSSFSFVIVLMPLSQKNKFSYHPKWINQRLFSSSEWLALFKMCSYLKLVWFLFTEQVAMKTFSCKLSALCSERGLFSSAPPHGFLENELSRVIPPQPQSPRNRRQVHLSQNFALEFVTADISCYSWASVGVVGMLLILCWHGCS